MNIAHKSLGWAFTLSLLFTIFMPVLLPSFKLMFFAPFLIILYYQKSYAYCLWGAIFCGLLLDLLAFKTPLGFYALTYASTTTLLYGQQRHFFADVLSTMPLMTLFFSILATLFQSILLYILQGIIWFSWQWVLTDVIIFPIVDAAFAFFVFILPYRLLGKKPRKSSEYFLS